MSKTIGIFGKTEIVIQKSRFICQAKRVETEKEATQFLMDIKKEHWNATHNCYAYVITSQIQKSSDDGEPAGTAGRPILEMIHTKELTHTAIIITRYYGGIKLGTGGLVRAYSQGASAAIEAAGTAERLLYQQLVLSFDYTFLGRIEHELRSTPLILDQPKYGENITWSIWIPLTEVEQYTAALTDWTGGQIHILHGNKEEKIIEENSLQ
jgi:uncharacterized YigZ family protein